MSKGWLLVAPAGMLTLLLFGGGLGLAVWQSLGYLPSVGLTHLSLAAYGQIWHNPAFAPALGLTLWVAGSSTFFSTVLAIGAALALRRHFQGRKAALFLFQLNLPIPHLVGGIMMLFLFAQSGWLARLAYGLGLIAGPAGFPPLVFDPYGLGIILEYVWKGTVFMGMVLLARLQTIGLDYEEMAGTLGAGRWQRFWHVTLPLLRPGIITTSILLFAFTFGAFEVPLLLGSRHPSLLPVLAYRLYTDVDLNARPQAMALSLLIAATITLLILLYQRLYRD